MKHVFLSIGLGVIIFAVYMMIYLGAFSPVAISKEEQGPFHMIYMVHRGAYHKIVPVIEKVETWAKEEGYPCRRSFGQYLDNTAFVEEERLTSRGGCIVEAPIENLPEGMANLEIPQQEFVVARFSGSPGIGPMKVYPKVSEWMGEHKLKPAGPVIEIYEILRDDEGMHTQYLFAIEQKEDLN